MNPVSAETWTHAEPVDPDPRGPNLAAEPAPPPPILRKSPRLAAVLSAFPGMGNIYNGLYLRGVTFFLMVIACGYIADEGHDLFGFVVAFVWLFNVIDAYRQATLINYGYAQDLGLTDLPAHPRAAQGGLAAGVLLSVIGIVAVLEEFFNLDVQWVFNLWPFALIGIGLWLIIGTLRERKG